MSNPWEDRRGMFQSGKQVHEPGRKLSKQFGDPILRRSSIGSDTLEKTPSAEPGAGASVGGSTGGRRRSSAASNGGLFNNLMSHKRGSEDYTERRASRDEMMNKPGVVSGWFGSTFKGMNKAGTTTGGPAGGMGGLQEQQQQQQKRGVME